MSEFFPLYQKGVFDYPMAMAIATLLGIGFGFALERGGFGNARVLVAQFYLTEMRVLKVMFSAIVVTAIGLGLLGGLDLVDLGAVQIPATFWWPQIVGGLLLGVGFIISGHCPGTAAVAGTSGNLDGSVTVLGVILGGLGFGLAYPLFDGLYNSGSAGVVTAPETLGVAWPILALVVTVGAIAAFFGAEAIERWAAKRDGTEVPYCDTTTRNQVYAGFLLTALAGVATLGIDRDEPAPMVRAAERLTPEALADGLITDPGGLWVIDLRDAAACGEARIPGALCLPQGEEPVEFLSTLPAGRKLVVYEQGDLPTLPLIANGFGGEVAVLVGGFDRFEREVLTAPAPPTQGTPVAMAEWQRKDAVYSHFTGAQSAPPPPPPKPRVVKRAARKGGGC